MPEPVIPPDGKPDDWVKARLAEMGLTEDDIGTVVEAGGGLHAEGGRWKICPYCKSNIDMLAWVEPNDGGEKWPRVLARAEIECPNCGAYGETMGTNAMNEPHPKLKTFKAKQIHNPMPQSNDFIRIAKGLVERHALFPSDPDFDPDEPHWPRDLGACVIAGGLIIASAIHKATKRPGKPAQRKWKPNRKNRRGNSDDAR